MNQTYYIAWHPDRGYVSLTLRRHPDWVEEALKKVDQFHNDWQIRAVRLVDVTKEGEKGGNP